MAANNPDSNPTDTDPAITELLAHATDVPLAELAPNPYRRPQPNNFFWRSIDYVGKFAAPVGGLITLVAFLVGLVGGPDFAWVGIFYIVSLFLFIIFIPAFLRQERRQREAKYASAQAAQIHLKIEMAQTLLQQKDKKNS
jgi:hypothetical protein